MTHSCICGKWIYLCIARQQLNAGAQETPLSFNHHVLHPPI